MVIKDPEGGQKFATGKYVLQLVTVKSGVVVGRRLISLDDYKERVESHAYISLIAVAPIHRQLAYYYDCLNREKGKSRDSIFIFNIRELGKKEWNTWFEVEPYVD